MNCRVLFFHNLIQLSREPAEVLDPFPRVKSKFRSSHWTEAP